LPVGHAARQRVAALDRLAGLAVRLHRHLGDERDVARAGGQRREDVALLGVVDAVALLVVDVARGRRAARLGREGIARGRIEREGRRRGEGVAERQRIIGRELRVRERERVVADSVAVDECARRLEDAAAVLRIAARAEIGRRELRHVDRPGAVFTAASRVWIATG